MDEYQWHLLLKANDFLKWGKQCDQIGLFLKFLITDLLIKVTQINDF